MFVYIYVCKVQELISSLNLIHHIFSYTFLLSSSTTRNSSFQKMATTTARLAPLLFSSKVLRPSIFQPKVELPQSSTRTPFSAVAPPRRHDQFPATAFRIQPQKNLETIFEE